MINYKRTFDILFSSLALIFFSPLIIVISFLILVFDGRPIFFIQERTGHKFKRFYIIKFRTMKNISKSSDGLSSNDYKRITILGNILRKLSFDEIPEFINVLLGNMSIVGPRPLLTEYDELYNSVQKKRFELKPGITGLAQINGRNNLTWEEKFNYDLEYINNYNLLLDIKIIIITVFYLFKAKNINSSNCETMPRFKGDKTKKDHS